ncbi:MAG: NAD(P)-dependent oxidoreductase [Opitutales bacterium]|nr:NAD(P)-dependent oxidoreductase [Opitutales bacterium]
MTSPNTENIAPPASVGVLGLGDMGLPIASNLHAAGYTVSGFDLRPEQMEALEKSGPKAAASLAKLVGSVDVILCSLPSSTAFMKVARDELLQLTKKGQRVLETGTTIPADFREVHREFADKGVSLNDAPLSGGKFGAEKRRLHVFFGGSEADFAAYRPLLAAFAGEDMLHPCGPAGAGQAMKGVNQLKMAFDNAAWLEILAFAQHSDLDINQVASIFAGSRLSEVAQHVIKEHGIDQGVKFRELPYYLEEARREGFNLPLTHALHAFCERGERIVVDDHRDAPSFWHELTRDRTPQSDSR